MASTIRMVCIVLGPMVVINLAVDPPLSRESTTEYLRGPPKAEAQFNSSFVLSLQLEFISGDVLHLVSSFYYFECPLWRKAPWRLSVSEILIETFQHAVLAKVVEPKEVSNTSN